MLDIWQGFAIVDYINQPTGSRKMANYTPPFIHPTLEEWKADRMAEQSTTKQSAKYDRDEEAQKSGYFDDEHYRAEQQAAYSDQWQ